MGLLIFGTLTTSSVSGERLAAGLDLMDLIFQAGLIVQLVLLLLVVVSVISWAVIGFKWKELRDAEQDSEGFLEVYRRKGFEAAVAAVKNFEQSPLAALVSVGSEALGRQARPGDSLILEPQEGSPIAVIGRRLGWAGAREIQRLERGLSYLATTGSASPFIGLFGTVIGIIGAFQGIGREGSASLAVVAPGIAEALIATAVGLLAAIPATVFYNHFLSRVGDLHTETELFVEELKGDLAQRLYQGNSGRSEPTAD